MKTRIGFLSTEDSLFLGRFLNAFLERDLSVDAIIFDSKGIGRRAHELHQERTAGRLAPLPVSVVQRKLIPRYQVDSHSSQETADLVNNLKIDLLINAGTPRILKRPILDAPRLGVLNCHPGLLPQFRGCTCVEWAIFLDSEVGNTVHFMDEGIDTGPIVLKEPLIFHKTDNYVEVRLKVLVASFALMARAATEVVQKQLRPSLLNSQAPGEYYRVIDHDKYQKVKEKLQKGSYVFQQ